jgi:uncharacterized LabA/DUF88 family protein
LSKNVAVFVDVANLYYSARGQDVDVDYVALLKAATKGRDLIRAYAYSGLDPENENQRKFIDFLGKNGYKVVVKDIRKFGDGRVKANLDIELVVDLFRLADRMDIAVVVSGDGDFAPAIRALQDKGVRCEVISFRPNTSSDLLAVADEFLDIMKVIGIGRDKDEKKKAGMSAPAMPAKEVVPEFGFREASPQIAAAALAAIKGAPEKRRQPAASSRNEETATGDDADGGEGRSRRRRRGGRGRGRGRGREAVTAGDTSEEPEGAGEIGWTELDDLSEIPDLDEEREYTFSEADPETLAELGLDAGAVDGATVADASAAAPDATTDPVAAKPRRRRRTKKEDAQEPAAAARPETADGADASMEGGDEKPRRRARRKPRAEGADAEPAAKTEAAEKPVEKKPRRRRTTKAADTDAGNADAVQQGEPKADAKAEKVAPKKPRARRSPRAKGDGDSAPNEETASAEGDESQGIWQRFRSARGGSRSS